MILMRGFSILTMLALAQTAQTAQAATFAVTAPINNNADPKIVLGAHQLMASELDFQEGVNGVTDLEQMPASLNNACLSNVSCLKGITTQAGTERLITGSMSPSGANIALDLLMYDSAQNKVLRRKTWTVPNDATALANEMTPILKELLTGQDPNAGSGTAVGAAAFSAGDAEDEFSFDGGGGGGGGGLTGDPEVDDLMAIDDLSDLDEPEERQQAAAAVAAAPAAVGAAATGAAVGAAAGAASNATGGAMSDEDVLSMISFGGGGPAPTTVPVAGVAVPTNPQTGMAMAQGAANSAVDNVIANNTPKTGNAMADKAIGGAAAAAADAAKGLIDLDSKATKDKVVREGTETVNVTVRGGYSTYYEFQFVTGGAEVGVPLGPINIVAGLETYAVQRTLPPEVQLQTGQIFEWNTIFPMNLGVLYRIETGSSLRPYVGADGILVQYYRDEIGGDWAGGARARGGADYFLTQNLGVNVNLAAGMWSGKNWPLIEPGVEASGLLPQVSGGIVAAF